MILRVILQLVLLDLHLPRVMQVRLEFRDRHWWGHWEGESVHLRVRVLPRNGGLRVCVFERFKEHLSFPTDFRGKGFRVI